MIKPNIPNMPNMPGMEAMADSLDFVKNLWSNIGVPGMNIPGMNMNIPGMVMPSLSVEEINKKIADLKAVESWLTLNMNMLRGTIQGLEVQAATISTLQQMGESFSATMNAGSAPSASGTTGAYGGTEAAQGNGRHAEQAQPAPEPTSKDEQDAASLTAPLVNAAAWWNVLQDQFQQAVSSAMASEPPAASSPPKPKAKATPKPKAKTASTASTGTTRKRKTAK